MIGDYLMNLRAMSKVSTNKQNSPFIGIHQAVSQIFLRKRSFCCQRDVRANLDAFIQSNHACKLENSPGQKCNRELSRLPVNIVILLITWFNAIDSTLRISDGNSADYEDGERFCDKFLPHFSATFDSYSYQINTLFIFIERYHWMESS